jgi:hypothetical protein
MPLPRPTRRHAVRALMLVASVVSGVATWTGFAELTASPLWAALATLFVQAMIVLGVAGIFADWQPLARLLAALLYLFFVLISVAFGYGFYFDRLSGAQHGVDMARDELLPVVQALDAFDATYARLARTAHELAEHSAAQAAEEARIGGTCGGPRLRNAGPRSRLRTREATTFATFADGFAARAEAARAALAETEAALARFAGSDFARAVRDADAALARARSIALDPLLDAWRQAAALRLEASRTGFVDPLTGEAFRCPDPRLDTLLATARGIVLPALPERLGRFFAPERGAAVHRAFGILLGGLTGDPAGFERAKDALPLTAALVVDGGLLLLGFLGRMPEGPGRAGPRSPLAGLAQRLAGRPALPEGWGEALLAVVDQDALAPLRSLLERWTLVEGGRCFLLAPAAAAGEAASVPRVAGLLVELGLAHRLGPVRVARLPAWWCHGRPLDAHGWVVVWRLRRRLLAQLDLEALWRRLADEVPAPVDPAAVEILPPLPAAEPWRRAA